MPGGYVMVSETNFTAQIGTSFTGADIGLSGYPDGYFEIIAETAPGAVSEADQPYASFCLGLTCVPSTGAVWQDGTQVIWVVFQQQETSPGVPFGDGQYYNSVGMGNAVPSSTPYSHRTTGWDTQDFDFSINFGGYGVVGTDVSVICRQYEYDPGPINDYDLLPPNSGSPGDPGYIADPSPVTATENENDRSLITLEWGYTPNPADPDGFAIFWFAGPDYPSPHAIVGADARSYAFLDEMDRSVIQEFTVTAFDATKHSDGPYTPLAAIQVELEPAAGIMSPGAVHNIYILRLEASNGLSEDATFTYALTGGALPDGLSLIPASGIIVGIPTLQGDYFFEVTASSAGVLDSNPNSYEIIIALSVPWTVSPPGNDDVKEGETLTISSDGDPLVPHDDNDDDLTFIATTDGNNKVAQLIGPPFEFPYFATGPCLECLNVDCITACSCFSDCVDDAASPACQECIESCFECLLQCLENIADAEDCNETVLPGVVSPPSTTVTVYGGTRFHGTVPLASWPILEADASGLYKFVLGQTYDVVYTPARDGNIYHVKIPNPGGLTGFFKA